MSQSSDFEVILSNLKSASPENASKKEIQKICGALDSLLTPEGAQFLKSQGKYFDFILPLFTKLIFSDDIELAKHCFKHFDAITDIFRSKLPSIKKCDWWKRYELDLLVKSIPKLSSKISPSDDSWVQIWSFVANLIISDTALSTLTLNSLLSISEMAFKKGRENSEVLDQAWLCWVALIDAFGRSPKILLPSKKLNLLMKPLQACHNVSKYRLSTWVHLIEVKGLPATDDTVKNLVESLCIAMYKASGEKAISRHLPDECAQVLVRILSFEKVVEAALPCIIDVFGACVNSRSSAKAIEEVATAIIRLINDCKDDASSYRLWKSLLEQYQSCAESPISAQACQVLFTDVNFHRWVDSGTIEGKEIVDYMNNSDFRSKVLLRSIHLVPDDDQKRKSKKSSADTSWINYCEAYLSWWADRASSPSETDQTSSDHQECDIQATAALLTHPIPMNNWSPATFKTWTLLCEVCHKQRILPSIIRSIFNALDEQHFQVQKTLEILGFVFGLDVDFCKMSTKLLEALSSTVYSMEVKQIMDTLSLLEAAGSFVETTSVVGKIIKNVNEKCSELDNLNAHKIRTKVGKITRKIEQSNPSESKAKTQRTPFRTQSNFLQRLAKAEERNKTKNTFLSSIFSSGEKTQEEEDNEQTLDASPQESPAEKVEEVPVKNFKIIEDSENVPFVVPLLSPANGEKVDEVVAEKENVILPAPSPAMSSPGNKLKITNARELKTVDSSPLTKKVKPVAGLKVTPKKVTPSKVSYFDDDASDCVMVPPKPKTTPLTEHQMEMMSKRRTDIPALYQDLSQDTQLSNNPPTAVFQEMSKSSPKEVPDSEDIVLGTPSPEEVTPIVETPERTKSGVKVCSAKKLDFNCLMSTPPSKSSTPRVDLVENGWDITPVKEEPLLPIAPACSDQNGVPDENEGREKLITPKREGNASGEEKGKRKRKSEPVKFSPKLTRSKKSLKSTTPDPKLATSSQELASQTRTETVLEIKSESEKVATKEEKSGIVIDAVEEGKREIVCEAGTEGEPLAMLVEEAAPQTPDAMTRKRKIEESSVDSAKKPKLEEDSVKKTSSLKKKRKPFRLSGGSNLENWLVKTERVTHTASDTVKVEDEEPSSEKSTQEDATVEKPVDMNNSEEIVPCTQDVETASVLESQTSLPNAVIEEPGEDAAGSKDVDGSEDIAGSKGAEDVMVDVSGDLSSKESVLDKLSRESPNDDIELIISPSKRQRRATSVFRGEGDTYLAKDPPKSVDEFEGDGVKRAFRDRNRASTSPVTPTRKNLHPLCGRSAKMLRMAASVQGDTDVGLVTPNRRRESIAPVTYGENWPKGYTEDWIAYTPTSSFASPFRSAMKKTPLPGEETPTRQDLTTSPLNSSSKRKRVVFLDPPVTRGLIYERDSPFGSLHHADVPNGSPYPTWRGGEDPVARRLISRVDNPPTSTTEDVVSIVTPNASEEVRMLIDHSPDLESKLESALTTEINLESVQSTESQLADLKNRHQLDDSFMDSLAAMDPQIGNLIVECLNSVDMVEVISNWKLKDCKTLCDLPFSFLSLVKNSHQSLVDALAAVVFTVPTNVRPPEFADADAQTSPDVADASTLTSIQTRSSSCQTLSDVRSCHTNTDAIMTTDSTTQEDLKLPCTADLRPLLMTMGSRQSLKYFSDALRLLSET